MTEDEFCSKHGIIRMVKTINSNYGLLNHQFGYNTVQVDITEIGINSLMEISERDNTALELMHREHYENYMREKYPGIKTAWEHYQLLLKIANA